jgi:hypothetical protein
MMADRRIRIGRNIDAKDIKTDKTGTKRRQNANKTQVIPQIILYFFPFFLFFCTFFYKLLL